MAARGLGAWLAGLAPARARGHLTIALVSDRRIRALNQMYRGIDEVTDVLSFPSGAGAPGGPGAPDVLLGDVAIATGVTARQARMAGHSVRTELRVLSLHGLLHLLGFDHDTDNGRMARVEARLRRTGGLPLGLIARAHRPSRERGR